MQRISIVACGPLVTLMRTQVATVATAVATIRATHALVEDRIAQGSGSKAVAVTSAPYAIAAAAKAVHSSDRFFAVIFVTAFEAVSLRSALLSISLTDVVVAGLAARLVAFVNFGYTDTMWTVRIVHALHATMRTRASRAIGISRAVVVNVALNAYLPILCANLMPLRTLVGAAECSCLEGHIEVESSIATNDRREPDRHG